jgi:hypothetical protein
MVSTHSIMVTALACLAFSVAPVTATTYSMVKEYYGSNFFNEWTFYNNCSYFMLNSPCLPYLELTFFSDDNLTNGDVT